MRTAFVFIYCKLLKNYWNTNAFFAMQQISVANGLNMIPVLKSLREKD
jgi:hypothetical protein